jgi:aspartate/methionine/tyrosine aminotransferase
MPQTWAPYMHWAKIHEPARWELSGSNLLPCSLADLPGWEEHVELHGPNDEGYAPLTTSIGAHYGVLPARVCTAAGASGANFLAIAASVRPGEAVLVESPGYDPHAGSARLIGAEVRTFVRRFEDGFKLDSEAIAAALTPHTRMVIVTNPHNPSGVRATEDELRALARVADERNVRVLVDEVYLDASPGRGDYAASLSSGMISTSSLTKSYGLSGLRIGWAVASGEIAEEMRRVRDVVDAVGSFPAERLGVLAFRHLEALSARAENILGPNREMVEHFVDTYDEIEWVTPTGGAVAFPRIQGLDDVGPFVRLLRSQYDVGLVPGSFFDTPEHFRIAMGGAREVLEGGLAALGRAMSERAWRVT